MHARSAHGLKIAIQKWRYRAAFRQEGQQDENRPDDHDGND
jgi:hypothetical protein